MDTHIVCILFRGYHKYVKSYNINGGVIYLRNEEGALERKCACKIEARNLNSNVSIGWKSEPCPYGCMGDTMAELVFFIPHSKILNKIIKARQIRMWLPICKCASVGDVRECVCGEQHAKDSGSARITRYGFNLHDFLLQSVR